MCKCYRGRKYQVDSENSKHSLIFCNYCGSHGIHLGCLASEDSKEFFCHDCESILNKNPANAQNSTTDDSDRGTFETVESRNSFDSRVSGRSQPNRRSNVRYGRNRRSQRGIVEIESDTEERFGPHLIQNNDLMKHFKLRDCSVSLMRLTPKDLGLKLEPNRKQCEIASKSTITSGSSSDEQQIKPTCTSKSYIIEDSDSDIGCVSTESYSQMDINENSRNVPSSNVSTKNGSVEMGHPPTHFQVKTTVNGLHVRQFSSSDDDKIRPVGPSIRKLSCFDSSDDQTFGKENEVPAKSIAIVRPFTNNETSSDESVRPAKIRPRQRLRISSSEETSDDLLKPLVSPENRTCIVEKESETEMDLDEASTASDNYIQKKRKRRTVLSYFRETSSSDDEVIELKPKRKSPKNSKQRSPATTVDRPPTQSSIMHFFKRHINQNT